MKVFYSHPIERYGTDEERSEVALIERRFPGCEVVDPSAHQSIPERGRETEYYLGLLDKCDCLAFSRSYGNVTEGVKKEVDHALSARIPVYEISDGTLTQTYGPVANLPLKERLLLRARKFLGVTRREPSD